MVDVIAALKQCGFFESCWQIDQRYKSCWMGFKCMGIFFLYMHSSDFYSMSCQTSSVCGFGSFLFKCGGETCLSILLLKEDIALIICPSQGLVFSSKSFINLPPRADKYQVILRDVLSSFI